MEDAEDFDSVQFGSDTVRDDVACSGNYQFPSAVDSARTAKGRIFSQETNGAMNALNQRSSRSGILPSNVPGFAVQIPQRRREPPNPARAPHLVLDLS